MVNLKAIRSSSWPTILSRISGIGDPPGRVSQAKLDVDVITRSTPLDMGKGAAGL
jgi:hypothetical protein